MNPPLVDRSVTHVHQGDRVFAPILDLPGDPCGERNLTTDDTVTAHEAAVRIEDVH